jgi:hypothetical protein
MPQFPAQRVRNVATPMPITRGKSGTENAISAQAMPEKIERNFFSTLTASGERKEKPTREGVAF